MKHCIKVLRTWRWLVKDVRSPEKKQLFFRGLLELPPPSPNSVNLYNFFSDEEIQDLKVIED